MMWQRLVRRLFVVISFVFISCLGSVLSVILTTGFMLCSIGAEYLRVIASGCVLALSLCVCVFTLGCLGIRDAFTHEDLRRKNPDSVNVRSLKQDSPVPLQHRLPRRQKRQQRRLRRQRRGNVDDWQVR